VSVAAGEPEGASETALDEEGRDVRVSHDGRALGARSLRPRSLENADSAWRSAWVTLALTSVAVGASFVGLRSAFSRRSEISFHTSADEATEDSSQSNLETLVSVTAAGLGAGVADAGGATFGCSGFGIEVGSAGFGGAGGSAALAAAGCAQAGFDGSGRAA